MVYASHAFGIPYPYCSCGRSYLSHERIIISRISILLASGSADHRHAAIPATRGHANDVPLLAINASLAGLIRHVPSPTAHTSGLILPSADGPYDEKLAICPSRLTAPTLSMLSASAGVER